MVEAVVTSYMSLHRALRYHPDMSDQRLLSWTQRINTIYNHTAMPLRSVLVAFAWH